MLDGAEAGLVYSSAGLPRNNTAGQVLLVVFGLGVVTLGLVYLTTSLGRGDQHRRIQSDSSVRDQMLKSFKTVA